MRSHFVILVPFSKHEISNPKTKIAISSRSMRLKERNSRSRLETRDWKTDILDLVWNKPLAGHWYDVGSWHIMKSAWITSVPGNRNYWLLLSVLTNQAPHTHTLPQPAQHRISFNTSQNVENNCVCALMKLFLLTSNWQSTALVNVIAVASLSSGWLRKTLLLGNCMKISRY